METHLESCPGRLLVSEGRDSKSLHRLLTVAALEVVDEAALRLVDQLVDVLVRVKLKIK